MSIQVTKHWKVYFRLSNAMRVECVAQVEAKEDTAVARFLTAEENCLELMSQMNHRQNSLDSMGKAL